MADQRPKDVWDRIAAVTPLILGVAVTAVGAAFTNVYNLRQLQLNQITALDRLRSLLTSDKPEEREFGYASFAALGYERMAIRIIALNRDESGRQLLIDLTQRPNAEMQTTASSALNTLDQVAKGPSPTWTVVISGDKSLDLAKRWATGEVGGRFSPATIYWRDGVYRVTFGRYDSKRHADDAAIAIRPVTRPDAYVVALERWCRAPTRRAEQGVDVIACEARSP